MFFLGLNFEAPSDRSPAMYTANTPLGLLPALKIHQYPFKFIYNFCDPSGEKHCRSIKNEQKNITFIVVA